MAVLDVRDFALANVVAPAQGVIQRFLYWLPGMAGVVELTGPLSVPTGVALTLYVAWINSGQVVFTGHVDLSVTKPDGTTLTPAAVSGQDVVATPGNGAIPQFSPVLFDQAGAYSGRAVLNG